MLKPDTNLLPLLLRQKMVEADSLNIDEQERLRREVRLENLVPKFKALDKQLESNTITLTEDEIAELVSNNRKKRYEGMVAIER